MNLKTFKFMRGALLLLWLICTIATMLVGEETTRFASIVVLTLIYIGVYLMVLRLKNTVIRMAFALTDDKYYRLEAVRIVHSLELAVEKQETQEIKQYLNELFRYFGSFNEYQKDAVRQLVLPYEIEFGNYGISLVRD